MCNNNDDNITAVQGFVLAMLDQILGESCLIKGLICLTRYHPTGYKFRYGHTFGQLTHNTLGIEGRS